MQKDNGYSVEEQDFDTVSSILKEKRENINSIDDLNKFLMYVEENCGNGYSEAASSVAQVALATAWYFSKKFEITGFQASCAMWDFIREWQYIKNKCGMKLVNYDDMLYPQYNYKFQKTISKDTFNALQEKASELLNDVDKYTSPRVIEHWESIVEGKVPFGYVIDERC